MIFIDFSKLSQSGKAVTEMPGNRMRNRLLLLASGCLANCAFYRQKQYDFLSASAAPLRRSAAPERCLTGDVQQIRRNAIQLRHQVLR